MDKKVAIIGAGPAGLTAAYELAKKIKNVDVYEASPSVGGLAKTIELWGQKVDIGPHRFFSTDARVNKVWLEVAGNNYSMVQRLTRIYYNNRFFYYPLKPFNVLKNLGFANAVSGIASYLKQQVLPRGDESNFEGWVTKRFGKRLYNIFFKTYSEKLWGIPATELNADFAAQRIKKLSLGSVIINSIRKDKGHKHKTLVDEFAYPHGGTGSIYEKMAAFIQSQGGNIFLSAPVKKVLVKDNAAYGIELVNGETREYDSIISTMPLTTLVNTLPGVPDDIKQRASQLQFRNTIIVYLNVQAVNLFPDNWVYIHSAEVQMGRLTNFRNWVPQLYGESQSTICALEYWCNSDDEFWARNDEKIIAFAKEELQKTGLTGSAAITQGYVYRVSKCYPVYKAGYKENLIPVENYLKTIKNLQAIGRYGAFKYNNQDHSILMGLLAAENILDGTNHNLWEINTDYDNYQEKAVITKTGLQKE